MHPFLFALLLAAVPLAAGQLEPRRTFQGQRHLHQATPYGPGRQPGRLPTFAHAGGPPDVTGVFYADNYIGFVSHGGFVSTVLFPDGKTFQSQMGRYVTWECTDLPGGYIATSHRVDTYSNGTVEYRKRCEVGRIDLDKGVWYWNSQTDGCPDPADTGNQIFPLDSTALPAAKKLFCTGDNPGAGFDNTSPLGLDLKQDKYTLGTTVDGPPLPPPLEGGPPPPVYKSPGGSPDTVGIWFSNEKTTGEIKNVEGFSSIQLIDGIGFQDVLGRWNSYECGDKPGAYRSSLSYTQINQDMTRNSGDTCTDGIVDLAANEYTWRPGEGRGCPLPSTPDYPVKRVTDSKEVPTPTKLTCT